MFITGDTRCKNLENLCTIFTTSFINLRSFTTFNKTGLIAPSAF